MENNQKYDLFIFDNGTNYLLFSHVATYLKNELGLSVLYVTLVPARLDYFKQRNIPAVLLSAAESGAELRKRAEGVIRETEDNNTDYRFRHSIKKDRVLRYLPYRKAAAKLMSLLDGFVTLLDKHQPRLVIGEISWAVEHLFFHVCKDHGIIYRHILNLPGQDVRITGFDSDHSASGTGYVGRDYLEQKSGVEKSYYELCGAVKGYKPTLSYFIENFSLLYSPNDYRTALFYRIRRLFLPLYAQLQRLFEYGYATQAPLAPEGNVLLVLHVQPESTPDYVAPYHSDQLALAHQVIEALPEGDFLYIKDHPNLLSIRNLWAWRKLLKTGRVKYLQRKLPGKDLLRNFELIVSIAGTALYETARLGIPAISISNVFFNELPNVIDARQYPSMAAAISAAKKMQPTALSEQVATDFLAQFGLPGFIADARIAPDVLKTKNIQRLANLIEILLSDNP